MSGILSVSSQESASESRPALEWRGKGWAPQLVQRFLGHNRSWQVHHRNYTWNSLFCCNIFPLYVAD